MLLYSGLDSSVQGYGNENCISPSPAHVWLWPHYYVFIIFRWHGLKGSSHLKKKIRKQKIKIVFSA